MSTSARSEILARVRKASRGSSAESLSQQLQGLGVAPAAPLSKRDFLRGRIGGGRHVDRG